MFHKRALPYRNKCGTLYVILDLVFDLAPSVFLSSVPGLCLKF